jgi:uncharacterized protein (TIGR03067 family)
MKTPDGQDFESKGEIKIDENTKPHKSIDWIKFVAPNGDDVPDNLGIYVFEDDDTIKIVNGGPRNERPSEFKDGEGPGRQVTTLKRHAKQESEKKDEPKGDLAKLQGEWTGMAGPEKNVLVTVTFKVTSAVVEITRPDGEVFKPTSTIKLDETAKPHKTIDWTGLTRPDGTAIGDNLGIYIFESETTLKVCSGGPGNARPTEFKDGDGSNVVVLTKKAAK